MRSSVSNNWERKITEIFSYLDFSTILRRKSLTHLRIGPILIAEHIIGHI